MHRRVGGWPFPNAGSRNIGEEATRQGGSLARGTGRLAALSLVLLGGLLGVAPTAGAQEACRTNSFIPTTSVLYIRNVSTGQIVALQQSNYSSSPTVHVWTDNVYVGQHYIPVQIYPNELDVLLRTELRNEIWMGQVRQVQKVVPYVRACGSWYW
jgi:hypothetical protein